jgi:hypothetical protein
MDEEKATTELFGTVGRPDPDPRDVEHPGPAVN